MKKAKRVSVVTPTFNRGNLLRNLYESLKEQTCNDFKWLIVDDGSSDDTRAVVKSFVEEGIVDITYLYQENGGKHRALNRAIKNCDSELFFIVDSDDMLTCDSIEKVISVYQSIPDEKKEEFCGVAGLRIDSENKSKTNELKEDLFDATALEATYDYNLFGDKAEVFRTKILKKYKFPEFKGENFITENVVWHKIASDGYKMRWFNDGIYRCDYRADGLTKNMFQNVVKNCRGESFYHNQESSFNISLKWKIKHQANYYRFGLFYTNNIIHLFEKSMNKKLAVVSIPIGVVAAFYTKLKLKA